jgi:hypothetical protein
VSRPGEARRAAVVAVGCGVGLAMLAEPLIDLLRCDRRGRARAEWFSPDGIFGPAVIGGGEMRLGVFHRHLGKLAEGDGLSANQFRELDLAPRIGCALLVERECIAAATDFFTVLLAVNVVVDLPATGTDRTFEYAFHLWRACSRHSASDVLIVPTGTKTGTKQKSHTGEAPPSCM